MSHQFGAKRMTDYLEKLKELCDKATPGPWENEDHRERLSAYRSTGCIWFFGENKTFTSDWVKICQVDYESIHSEPGMDTKTFEANASFIVEARTAIPKLIEAVEVMRDALDGVKWGRHCSSCSCVCHTHAAKILKMVDEILK